MMIQPQIDFCPLFAPNFHFGEIFRGLNIISQFSNPPKAHPCLRPCRLSHRAWKSVKGS